MNLGDLINSRGVITLEPKRKDYAVEELVDALGKRREVTSKEKLRRAIKDREKILSTGIGSGIAVPHAKIAQVKSFCAVVGICKEGIDFSSQDGKPVQIIFMIAATVSTATFGVTMLAYARIFTSDHRLRSAGELGIKLE